MLDLVALSALPAVWAGYQPRQVAEGLADVLLSTVGLDLVYLRLPGQTEGQEIEVARTAGRPATPDETRDMARTLAPWLDGGSTDAAPSIPNPAGSGTARLVVVPIGYDRQGGVLVAGSQQTGFPSEEDRLLLSVGANQAAAVLQRQRAEAALRESDEELRLANARLELAVRGSNISIWEIDMPDGDYRHGRRYYVNIWEQLGYEHPDSPINHETSMTLVHPDDRALLEEAMRRYLAGQTSEFEVENRARHKDGSYRWVLSRGVAVRDAGGKPIRFVGSAVDITDRKRAEAALRESERRFRILAEALPHMVWTAKPDGALDYQNARTYEYTGLIPEQLRGWEWRSTIRPDDLPRCLELWTRSIATGEPFEIEFHVRRADGAFRWHLARALPLRDESGRITTWFGSSMDIDDQKRAHEALRESKEAAEAANRAKDEFLANVSHEIRTPMNAILGMTELALDTPLTEDQRQCLKTVKSAADNLLGIINDLLDFSKIEAGKLELNSADFSLRGAVGDTLRALAVRAHKKGLELVCHVQPDVPDALVGDAGRLRQVLLNLVGNAIKFTDQGGVEIHAAQVGDRFELSVVDSGSGISPADQARIFDEFQQVDNTSTRKKGGTGLGLSISRRIVELHGGGITVESELGKGSTFKISIPVNAQPLKDAAQ